MSEKIEQLCDQIKDLLKKNSREYIVVNTLVESYTHPQFTIPEYLGKLGHTIPEMGNFIPYEEIKKEMYSSYDSLGIDYGDFVLDLDEDFCIEDYYDEDSDENKEILLSYITEDELIAVRIESDKLVFCVEEIFIFDEQPACENVKEISISSLVEDYDDETVVCALEACVRILSDETKNSIFWKI